MLGGNILKSAGVVTLFFFILFTFSAELAMAKTEDDSLVKARRLYQQGEYESAIEMLSDFVQKLKAMVEQKKNVAEAFYLLAKIYYEVGDDSRVEENLRKCYDTYPAFTMEESNLGFKDRVDKIKKEVLEQKTKEIPEEPTIEEQPITKKKVIEQQYPASREKKKKFPVLLVVGGAVVLGVVLALTLGKKKKEEVFDIRGQWTIQPDIYIPIHMTFIGSLANGRFTGNDAQFSYEGNYNVNGRQVEIICTNYPVSFTGTFTDKDHMNGNYVIVGGNTGTWSSQRGFIPFSAGSTSTLASVSGKK